jgi:AmpE protein
MALDLLSILIVLGLSATAPDLARLRDYSWLYPWVLRLNHINRPNGFWRTGLGLLLTLGVPVALVALVQWLLAPGLNGVLGFVFGVATLYYCFGPRDLDQDVADFVDGTDPDSRLAAAQALRIDPMQGFGNAVDGIFDSALKRWFGVLFWFLLFGAAGALLYRLAQLLSDHERLQEVLPPGQIEWAQRLWAAMSYLPAHLMSLALALASDFDSVAKAWRRHHEAHGEGWLHLELGFLTAAARALVDSDDLDPVDAHSGSATAARQAQQLIWRVLIVWLAALAMVVLLGWSH